LKLKKNAFNAFSLKDLLAETAINLIDYFSLFSFEFDWFVFFLLKKKTIKASATNSAIMPKVGQSQAN